MTINKRKKNSRLRGSHTHGWGAKKKHRGSGSRGGRGRAGSGKRADSKKPSIWNDPTYFGKHGFIPKGPAKTYEGISIKTIEDSLNSLIAQGAAKASGDATSIDLTAAGYTKLLSSGTPTRKLAITVTMASPRAIEKIKAAGGTVTVQHTSKTTR